MGSKNGHNGLYRIRWLYHNDFHAFHPFCFGFGLVFLGASLELAHPSSFLVNNTTEGCPICEPQILECEVPMGMLGRPKFQNGQHNGSQTCHIPWHTIVRCHGGFSTKLFYFPEMLNFSNFIPLKKEQNKILWLQNEQNLLVYSEIFKMESPKLINHSAEQTCAETDLQ